MDNTEDRERMAAALAMASLADSVPVSPVTEGGYPPPLSQGQTTSAVVSVAASGRKKRGRPQLPKLTISPGADTMNSSSTPSPGTASKGAVLPKIPRTMMVKNALVQKIQGTAAAQRHITEVAAAAASAAQLEASSQASPPPAIQKHPTTRNNPRGSGGSRGSGGKIRGSSRGRGSRKQGSGGDRTVPPDDLLPGSRNNNNSEDTTTTTSNNSTGVLTPLKQLSPTMVVVPQSHHHQMMKMRGAGGILRATVIDQSGSILRRRQQLPPSSSPLCSPSTTGNNNTTSHHNKAERLKIASLTSHGKIPTNTISTTTPSLSVLQQHQQQSPIQLVQPVFGTSSSSSSSGGLVTIRDGMVVKSPVKETANGSVGHAAVLGLKSSNGQEGGDDKMVVLNSGSGESHPPLHQMKLPEQFKEKYEAAMQQFILSPITPPEGGGPGLALTAKTEQERDREQSEPLDLSTFTKEKSGLSHAPGLASPQMLYAPLPPGTMSTNMPSRLLPMQVPWPHQVPMSSSSSTAPQTIYHPHLLSAAAAMATQQGQGLQVPLILAGGSSNNNNSPSVVFSQFGSRAVQQHQQPFLVNPGLLTTAMATSFPPQQAGDEKSKSEKEGKLSTNSTTKIVGGGGDVEDMHQIRVTVQPSTELDGKKRQADRDAAASAALVRESLSPSNSNSSSVLSDEQKKLPPKKRRRLEQMAAAAEEGGVGGLESSDSAYISMDTKEMMDSNSSSGGTMTTRMMIVMPPESPISLTIKEAEASQQQLPLLSSESGIGSSIKSPVPAGESLMMAGPQLMAKAMATSIKEPGDPPLPRMTDAVEALRVRSHLATSPSDAIEKLRSRPVVVSSSTQSGQHRHPTTQPDQRVAPQSSPSVIVRAPVPPGSMKVTFATGENEQLRWKIMYDMANSESHDQVLSLPHDLGASAPKVTQVPRPHCRPPLKRTSSVTFIPVTTAAHTTLQNGLSEAAGPVVNGGDLVTRSLTRDTVNNVPVSSSRKNEKNRASATRSAEERGDEEGEVQEVREAGEHDADSPDLLEECQRSAQADEDGDLPIHIAVVHGNLTVLDRLLYMMRVAKIPVDYYNNLRQTPLHLAIITQNDIAVTRLLDTNANPNLPDRKGQTGLHLSVKYRTKPCMKAILENASCELQLDAKNYEGFTALHLAVIDNQIELVQMLVDAGAALDVVDGKSGRTALFHAAEAKLFTIASLLLQRGASVNTTNYSGNTAVQAANGRGHTEMVALFIKYGADVTNSMRDSDVKSDQKQFVVSQNMSQVRETVRDNMLKRQQRKRQLVDPRTVSDLLLAQRGEQYADDRAVIAISPETTPTSGGGGGRSFSPISVKSSDSVPQSPEGDGPGRISLPVVKAGILDKEQDLKDLQRALLEKIAPTPEMSPKRKSHCLSSSSMTQVGVVMLDCSPTASSDSESEGIGKRPPLTIDPRLVNIPSKMPRLEEGREATPIHLRNLLPSPRNHAVAGENASKGEKTGTGQSSAVVVATGAIPDHVTSQQRVVPVTSSTGRISDDVFTPEQVVIQLPGIRSSGVKVTKKGHMDINMVVMAENQVKNRTDIDLIRETSQSRTVSSNSSEAERQQQSDSYSGKGTGPVVTSSSQIYTLSSDSTTSETSVVSSSSKSADTFITQQEERLQHHQQQHLPDVIASSVQRSTAEASQESTQVDPEPRDSMITCTLGVSNSQDTMPSNVSHPDSAMETDEGITKDIEIEEGSDISDLKGGSGNINVQEDQVIMDEKSAEISETDPSGTTRLSTEEPDAVEVTMQTTQMVQSEVAMEMDVASSIVMTEVEMDDMDGHLVQTSLGKEEEKAADELEVSATSVECDSSCNETTGIHSISPRSCDLVQQVADVTSETYGMMGSEVTSSAVTEEVVTSTTEAMLDSTGREEVSKGKAERRNIFETLSETKLLMEETVEQQPRADTDVKVSEVQSDHSGKRVDDLEQDGPVMQSECTTTEDKVTEASEKDK